MGKIDNKSTYHEDKITKCCTCVIVNQDTHKILLEKRNKNLKLDPGALDFCSGHVEQGEVFLSAMRRELEEELGISRYADLRICDLDFVETNHNKIGKVQVKAYCAFTNMNEEDFKLQKEEVESVKYFEYDKVCELIKEGKTRFGKNPIMLNMLAKVNHIIKENFYEKKSNCRKLENEHASR